MNARQVRRMHQIDAVAVEHQAARGIDVGDKPSHFIGLAVAVEVTQAIDATLRFVAVE